MPVALGFHAQVQTQAALNQLLQDVQAERKRAIVVEGAQGRIITVLKKGNVLAELLVPTPTGSGLTAEFTSRWVGRSRRRSIIDLTREEISD